MSSLMTIFRILDELELEESSLYLSPDPAIEVANSAIRNRSGYSHAIFLLEKQVAKLRFIVRCRQFDLIQVSERNWSLEKQYKLGAEIHYLKAELFYLNQQPIQCFDSIISSFSYAEENVRSKLNELFLAIRGLDFGRFIELTEEDLSEIFKMELKFINTDEELDIWVLKSEAISIPGIPSQSCVLPREIGEQLLIQDLGFSAELIAMGLRRTIQALLKVEHPTRILAESYLSLSRAMRFIQDESRLYYVLDAIELFGHLKTKNGLGRALLELSSVLEDLGNFADALKAIEIAIEQLKIERDWGAILLCRYRQAVMARKMRAFKVSIVLLDWVEYSFLSTSKQSSFLSQVYSELIHSHIQDQNFDLAYKNIKKFISLDPDNYLPHLRRAELEENYSNNELAKNCYLYAAQLYITGNSNLKSEQFTIKSRQREEEVFLKGIKFCCSHNYLKQAFVILMLSRVGNINRYNQKRSSQKVGLTPVSVLNRVQHLAERCFKNIKDNQSLAALNYEAFLLSNEAEILINPPHVETPLLKEIDFVIEISDRLGSDGFLLDFAFIEEDIWVFICHDAKIYCHKLKFGPDEWRAKISKFDPSDRFYDSLNELADEIFTPMDDLLKGLKKLIIISNPETYGIPFHAMHWKGKELIEVFNIYYVTDGWDLICKTKSIYPLSLNSVVFAGAGELDYESGLMPLNVKEEHSLFSELFPENRSLDKVKELINNEGVIDLLHFACHGDYNHEAPLCSHVYLKDRPLFSFEIPFSNLKIGMVFMNACSTANGVMMNGGYIQSLASSFLQNGTDYVIATLWSVRDRWSIVFMESFYFALKSRFNPFEAMEIARRKLRDDPRSNKPEIWAPYVLFSHNF